MSGVREHGEKDPTRATTSDHERETSKHTRQPPAHFAPGGHSDTQENLEKELEASRKAEARLRDIIDTIPALAWCNLPDGSNEFVNKRWRDYTGLSTLGVC